MTYKRAGVEIVSGTSKKGEVQTDYNQLVDKFGQPQKGVDPHTNAEWWIKFSDGTVATVYGWTDVKPEVNTDWTIGGSDIKSVYYVKAILTRDGRQFFRAMWDDLTRK